MSQHFFKQNPDEFKSTLKSVATTNGKIVLDIPRGDVTIMIQQNRKDIDSFYDTANTLKTKMNKFLREMNILGSNITAEKTFHLMKKFDKVMEKRRKLEYETKKILVDIKCFTAIVIMDNKERIIVDESPKDYLIQLESFHATLSKYEKEFLLPLQDTAYRSSTEEAESALESAIKEYQQQIMPGYSNVFSTLSVMIDQLTVAGFFITIKK